MANEQRYIIGFEASDNARARQLAQELAKSRSSAEGLAVEASKVTLIGSETEVQAAQAFISFKTNFEVTELGYELVEDFDEPYGLA